MSNAAESLAAVGSPPSMRWRSSNRYLILGAALIVTLTTMIYFVALHGDFIVDDSLLLTENSLVQSSDGLFRIWFTTDAVDYWPITNSSFWFEWRIWDDNPLGYRTTNLALHIIDSLLLWAVLQRLGIPCAFLASLLFAVHPVNVESVAWIAQRKNLLALFFSLMSTWCWLKSSSGLEPFQVGGNCANRVTTSPSVAMRDRWYMASLLMFLAGMLSKGSVATLPLVLLLINWWKNGRVTKRDWFGAIPYLLIAFALTAVNLWFRAHGDPVSIRHLSLMQRVLGASAAVWFYLGKALVPLNLSFVYPQWNLDENNWRLWLALAALIITSIGLIFVRFRRFDRMLLVAWMFFLLALAPSLGFVDVGYMRYSLVADHYQHIALIAVVSLLAASYSILRRSPMGPTIAAALTAGLVGAFALLAFQRATLMSDPEQLYSTTLQSNPESGLCHFLMGKVLLDQGKNQLAQEQLLAAIQFDPDNARAHNNLGVTLTNDHRTSDAISQYEEALRLKPIYAEAAFNLGFALAEANRDNEAIAAYSRALAANHELFQAHINLAALYADHGKLSDAISQLQQARVIAQSLGKTQFLSMIQQRLDDYRAEVAGSGDKSAVPQQPTK